MTTESLSPASRIVIETSSRPPGERSTSISLIGGAEGAEPAARALARGAASAFPALAVEPSSWNDAPATKGAESGAPNRFVCAVGGAANVVGSGGRPSAVLPLDPAGAWTAADVATPATGGGVETSGFCPMCAASCAAARVAVTRFAGDAAAREMIGVGDAAFAIGETSSAEGFPGMASSRAKPAARTLSPLRSASGVRLPAKAPPGANGALTPSVRLGITPVNAEAPKWKARSLTSRPTVAALPPAARDAPLFSDFGPFVAGEASEGGLFAACGGWASTEAVRKANGNDAKSALSLSSE